MYSWFVKHSQESPVVLTLPSTIRDLQKGCREGRSTGWENPDKHLMTATHGQEGWYASTWGRTASAPPWRLQSTSSLGAGSWPLTYHQYYVLLARNKRIHFCGDKQSVTNAIAKSELTKTTAWLLPQLTCTGIPLKAFQNQLGAGALCGQGEQRAIVNGHLGCPEQARSVAPWPARFCRERWASLV